jgi:hypothetical protein
VLEQLKNFDTNRATIDELVALRAFARGLQSEYSEQTVEEPEWIGIQVQCLDREITAKNTDRLTAQLRDTENRLESLKTTTEKKVELTALKAKLQKKLGRQ